MSLKVWLPLDGDLRNLGCSDLQFTNENTANITIDNDGKIGKCYKRNSIQTEGRIIADKTLNLDGDLSMCCWAKVTGTVGDTANGLVSLHSHANNTGFGITVKQISTTDYRISCSTGNGSSRTFHSYYGTTNIKDAWHHLTLTYNNTLKQFKLWVDGKVEYTLNYTNASQAETLMLFEWSTTYNQVNYRPACSLNDVRIYDQCLSAAEVHEIAQGLILHYKLDGNGFGNPNLLAKYVVPGQAAPTSTANGGRTTWLGDYKITIPATENADTYFRLFMTEQLISGTTYTISCKVSGLLDGSYYRFPLFAQSNTGMGLLYIDHNGLCSLTFTMNWTGTQTAATGANGETVYVNFLDDAARSLVSGQGPITLYDFKLEKGDTATTWCPADSELAIDRTIIRDSSGYNHNATAPSTLATTSDTPRYSTATTFDGTNYGQIQSTIVESNHLSSEYTWAGWIYRDYTDESTRYLYNGIIRIYLNTNFSTRMQWNHSKSDGTSSTNTSDMGIIIPYREWTHLVWTFKDGYLKIYINGEYRNYSDRTSTGQFIKGYIGQMIGTNTSSVCQWIGNISDMRIYTTALLDTDIKLLYNMGMRVDNLQNLHTFEYKENTSNLFRSELIMPFAKTGYTEGNGNITTHNGSPAMDIRAHIFYQNLENSTSGFLKGYFEANTSYIFDMWIDTDAVIYNGNNVAGGLRLIYTDDSFEHAFVFTGGNKGWQHKVYITPSNKTLDRIEVYYYVGEPVYCRLDSCICPLSNLKLHKTGIFEGTNLLEETNTKLIKNALIETNEIIET